MKNNRWLPVIIILLLFILLSVLNFLNQSFYEGMDNITHYIISRYSFYSPHLFLDHWGKPVFTLLSSPFSQFGFKGLVFFNIIAGLTSSYFAYLIAKTLNYKHPWLAIPFVTLAPYFFMLHFTGLTEILFSTVLTASVYFALKNKYCIAALIISFIPLVRTEGIILLPFFFLFFIMRKRIPAMLLLSAGLIIYSFIGGFYYHDFLWLLHKNPYNVSGSVYGSGTFYHFFQNFKLIMGWPLFIFFIAGIFYWGFSAYKRKQERQIVREEMMLILLPFFTYFLLHSFLWWKGLGGSMGLLRVIVGVIPLASLVCLMGFNYIEKLLTPFKMELKSFYVITAFTVLYFPFVTYSFPIKPSSAEVLVKKTTTWLRDNKLTGNNIFYYNPYFILEMDFNPFKFESNFWMIHIEYLNENDVTQNGILLWDSQVGAFEGKMPIEKLLKNKEYTLLNVFSKQPPPDSDERYDEICVFRKTPPKDSLYNDSLHKILIK